MLISVVVPTCRRPDLLDRCLGALAVQDFDASACEIIVADDATSEATRRQVEGWASRSAIPMPSAGQGTAMLNIQEIGGEKGRGSQDKSREVCGWIVALNGQHKGEDFRLRTGKNVLGTAADCDIVLTDKKISRKHATLRYEGGEFQIADLDSSNGTFVNDEKVQKHDLIDNDIIKLGDIQFEFKCRAMREKRE